MKKSEAKKIITEAVICFLNGTDPNAPVIEEIPQSDKVKIEEVVRKTITRGGFLAFSYGTDEKTGKAYVGARIDPTGKKDWVLSKEELLYELPVKYTNQLHEFVNKIRKTLNS